MTPSAPPKLPLWIFVVTDLALVGAAAAIAYTFDGKPPAGWLITLVACVGAGALVGLVPLVADYERRKNEALDERQRALEALSRTVASSAEQLGIAASGLHEIAELAQKNLRAADHLPQKLQEKIASFQARLAEADEAAREELERELLALRTSESERLEATAGRIAQSAAEWTKLEAATRQHLAAASAALGSLPGAGTAAAAEIQAASARALAELRSESARLLAEATAAARTAAEARTAAVAELEARLASAADSAARTVGSGLESHLAAVLAALDSRLIRLEAAAAPAPVSPAPLPPVDAPAAAAGSSTQEPASSASPQAASATADESTAAIAAPRRPRRRREETAAEPAAATDTVAISPATPAPAAASEAASPAADATPPSPIPPPAAETPTPVTTETAATAAHPPPASTDSSVPTSPEAAVSPDVPDEPAPIPAAQIAEVAPVAPATAEPFLREPSPPPATDSSPAVEATPAPEAAPATPTTATSPAATPPAVAPTAIVPAEDDAPAEPPRPARKRTPKKPVSGFDDEPHLGLELDEPARAPGDGSGERVLTSDGATRLIATAYIGIGNRLFIRGDGPGLSWEKGVPLQFVSIGKWRWETDDATAPIRFKLYKNDEVECAALGAQALEPGHQQEVTATF